MPTDKPAEDPAVIEARIRAGTAADIRAARAGYSPERPFGGIPVPTDFWSYRRMRPILLHRFGDIFEVWRYCRHKSCGRRKSCKRSDWNCLSEFILAQTDENRRLLRYSIQNYAAGMNGEEATAKALARVEDEIARFGLMEEPTPPPPANAAR